MTTFPVSDVPTLFPYLVANRKSKAMISNPYLATWREGPLAATQRGERSLGFGAQMQGPTGPQQYQVQFSTTEEHVQLIERAKTLMARQAPGKSLGELHLQAMKLLVAALEKQKFSVTERPRRKAPASTHAAPARAQLPELTQRVAEARQACSREPAGGTARSTQTTAIEPTLDAPTSSERAAYLVRAAPARATHPRGGASSRFRTRWRSL